MSFARSSRQTFLSLALLGACRTAPPPSSFVDVPLQEGALPSIREVAGMRHGDEYLDVSLERDGCDLLLNLGWWRNLTESEMASFGSLDPDTPLPPVLGSIGAATCVDLGPRGLNVKAWNAEGMQPLNCALTHVVSCGNLGALHDWTRCRISMANSPVCVEITWGDQKHHWRIRP